MENYFWNVSPSNDLRKATPAALWTRQGLAGEDPLDHSAVICQSESLARSYSCYRLLVHPPLLSTSAGLYPNISLPFPLFLGFIFSSPSFLPGVSGPSHPTSRTSVPVSSGRACPACSSQAAVSCHGRAHLTARLLPYCLYFLVFSLQLSTWKKWNGE